MTTGLLALFGACVCGGISPADGAACPVCVEAWRPFIRRVDGQEMTDEDLAAVLAVPPLDGYALEPLLNGTWTPASQPVSQPAREPVIEWRANQRCWVCEERRKCRRDPDLLPAKRWICRDCLEVS